MPKAVLPLMMPESTIIEYKTENENVIVNIANNNEKLTIENFINIMSQMPTINTDTLRSTTSMPPKYLPSNNCDLDIGLERIRSIFPFSSIIGIKLEQAKNESRSPNAQIGEIIINSI